MVVLPIGCATIGAVLPFTPLASLLGFTTLPLAFFLILLGMIATYILLVEAVKARFYAIERRPLAPPATHDERRSRHISRRARRFTEHRGSSSAIARHTHTARHP